jgi:phospholipid/cholesterol/gamma-HCH transport system ATP-binding protein
LLADLSYLISGGKVAASGTPEELRVDKSDLVRQFMLGRADGPVPFHLPGPTYAEQLRVMAGT